METRFPKYNMAGAVNLKIDSYGASSIDAYLEYKRYLYLSLELLNECMLCAFIPQGLRYISELLLFQNS